MSKPRFKKIVLSEAELGKYAFLDRAIDACSDETAKAVLASIVALRDARIRVSALRDEIGAALELMPWVMDGTDAIKYHIGRVDDDLPPFIDALNLYVLTLVAGRSYLSSRSVDDLASRITDLELGPDSDDSAEIPPVLGKSFAGPGASASRDGGDDA